MMSRLENSVYVRWYDRSNAPGEARACEENGK